MQLAKLINSAGNTVVARVEADSLVVLDLAAAGLNSFRPNLSLRIHQSELPKALSPPVNASAVSQANLLAPIDQQEVWAAGVTYKRSQTAQDGRV